MPGKMSHIPCSAVYVLLSLNVASIIYCFEDTDEHKGRAQEADYREARPFGIFWSPFKVPGPPARLAREFILRNNTLCAFFKHHEPTL
jgi:hypothetical protein